MCFNNYVDLRVTDEHYGIFYIIISSKKGKYTEKDIPQNNYRYVNY